MVESAVMTERERFVLAALKADPTLYDAIANEVFIRAIVGWDEPVSHDGQQIGVVRHFSDGLLRVLLHDYPCGDSRVWMLEYYQLQIARPGLSRAEKRKNELRMASLLELEYERRLAAMSAEQKRQQRQLLRLALGRS